jgi:hypothetical protein
MDREYGIKDDAPENYELLPTWRGEPAAEAPVTELTQDLPKRQAILKFGWRANDARITLESRRDCLLEGQIARWETIMNVFAPKLMKCMKTIEANTMNNNCGGEETTARDCEKTAPFCPLNCKSRIHRWIKAHFAEDNSQCYPQPVAPRVDVGVAHGPHAPGGELVFSRPLYPFGRYPLAIPVGSLN